jgi:hypothetical protein
VPAKSCNQLLAGRISVELWGIEPQTYSMRTRLSAVDPHIQVRVSGTSTEWTAELAEIDTAATELPEVSVAKVSRGSTFQFEPRRSLPLTVV